MTLYGGALYGGAVDPEKFLPLLHVARADGKGMVKGLRGIPILPAAATATPEASEGGTFDAESGEHEISDSGESSHDATNF